MVLLKFWDNDAKDSILTSHVCVIHVGLGAVWVCYKFLKQSLKKKKPHRTKNLNDPILLQQFTIDKKQGWLKRIKLQ